MKYNIYAYKQIINLNELSEYHLMNIVTNAHQFKSFIDFTKEDLENMDDEIFLYHLTFGLIQNDKNKVLIESIESDYPLNRKDKYKDSEILSVNLVLSDTAEVIIDKYIKPEYIMSK